MAANKVAVCIKIWSILAILAIMAADSHGLRLKETKMSMYMHDFFGGPNATDVIVGGIPGKEWYWLKFGTLVVTDNLITQGRRPDSKPIARSQGFYAICSLDGVNAQSQVSILFTNKEYKGSTLELQGHYNQVAYVTEIPIVSGTGKFRFARGFATMETIHYDLSLSYTLYRNNITVQQYI